MGQIHVIHLRCGMPLIVETMSGVRSAALHWLFPAGSASDDDSHEGASTLIEELLLRGSGTRSSREDADAADRLGATRGTSLGTLTMAISSTMLGASIDRVLPLIVDMVRAPRMSEESLVAARELALQAIESLRDDPQERAMVLAKSRHHPFPLNRSGLGTKTGLHACTPDSLRACWQRLARPGSSVLGVAGAVEPRTIEATLNALLEGWQGATGEIVISPAPSRGYAHEPDPGSQVQIIVAHDAPREPDDDSLLEKLTVQVLSGGMSGRLFSEVREKRGLCYSVSAGYRGDKLHGTTTAYVGTTPERAQESLDVLMAELHRITTPAGRISGEEFARARVGMKSALVFSGESTGARAGALATDWRRLGRPRSLEEISGAVDRVTLDQLNAYLARRDLGRLTIQTLGPRPLNAP